MIKALQNLKLTEVQKEILDLLSTDRRTVKYSTEQRRQGITTVVIGWLLGTALENPNTKCMLFESSNIIVDNHVNVAADMLWIETEFSGQLTLVKRSKRAMEFDNGSSVLFAPNYDIRYVRGLSLDNAVIVNPTDEMVNNVAPHIANKLLILYTK